MRCGIGEEFNPECAVPTEKDGEGTILVWGCIAYSEFSVMFVCEGHIPEPHRTFLRLIKHKIYIKNKLTALLREIG